MFYVLLHTVLFSMYYRFIGMLFASLTVPYYSPVYEHVETYIASVYCGRQIELGEESQIIIARNTTSWINYKGYILAICSFVDDVPMGRSRRFMIWALRRTTLEMFINDLHKKHNIVDVVQVRTCSTYDWNTKPCPIRPVESILPPAPIKKMIADAEHFINSKDRYTYLGIPYRRGYLLEGFPGTGKSSCALCLAGAIKRPLCFMSLTNKNASDEWLLDMISRVPVGGIVLIDDYDRFEPSKNGGVTIAGLLNALDGVVAQTGKIIIIAANDISKIPEALLRPGRIDRRFSFGLSNKLEAGELFERFHGKEHKDLFIENFTEPKAAAAIISHLMRYDNGLDAASNII